MTLQEWVERLPETHAARREYDALRQQISDTEAALLSSVRTHDKTLARLAEAEARLDETTDLLGCSDARLADVQDKLSIALAANHDLRDERDSLQDQIGNAEALLREATAELQWWIDNHMCCYGHQGDLMTRLRDADMQKSSVSDRESDV